MYNDKKYSCIHKYGLRRFYDDVNKTGKKETYSDLIEVVLIELQKLKKEDSEAANLLSKLIFNTNNIPEIIEKHEQINLTKIKRGVYNMIDYEARLEKRVAEAKAEVTENTLIDTAKNFIESMRKKNPKASNKVLISSAVDMLGLNENIAQKLCEIYK